jgi:hypothetical protein
VSYLKPVDREEGRRAWRVGARHGLVERLSSRRRQRSIAGLRELDPAGVSGRTRSRRSPRAGPLALPLR